MSEEKLITTYSGKNITSNDIIPVSTKNDNDNRKLVTKKWFPQTVGELIVSTLWSDTNNHAGIKLPKI